MLNIIIPLAGSSDPFVTAGYLYPKPLIEITGKPMIEVVLQNPSLIRGECLFIFIVKEEDCIKYHLDNILRLLRPECKVIKIKNSTSGALASILLSIDSVFKSSEMLILNADQIIDMDFNVPIDYFRQQEVDCGVVTFPSIHPRWSYALTDLNHNIIQTAEKNPISKNAIAGFYYFNNVEIFFLNAFKVFKKNSHTDNVFYTSSVINEYILENRKTIHYSIKDGKYFSFYSPQIIKDYELKIKYAYD